MDGKKISQRIIQNLWYKEVTNVTIVVYAHIEIIVEALS